MSINRFPTISARRAERSSRNPELPEESLTSDSSDRTEHETVQILPVVRWLCATPHGDGGKMASLVPCVAGKHFFRVDSRNCRSLSCNLIDRETLLPREPHTRTSDGILSVPVAHRMMNMHVSVSGVLWHRMTRDRLEIIRSDSGVRYVASHRHGLK